VSRSVPEIGPGPGVDPKLVLGNVAGTIAVMSHHATFALQMRQAGLDVLESRDVDELAGLARTVDVVVVDLVAIDGRRGLVARLSTSIDPAVPVVLISADDVDLALLGPARSVHVVVPPVRADDVVTCVRRILSESGPLRSEFSLLRPEPVAAQVAAGQPIVTPLHGREARKAGRRGGRAGLSPALSAKRGADRVVDLTRAGSSTSVSWRPLADQLADAVRGIAALPAAAQGLALDVAGTCGADVAVVVRDADGSWRVEGGVGLRPFEWGQVMADDDWLVAASREKFPSLLIADTEAVRGDLLGAPLASRHQVVRTHASRSDFLVCAGWSDQNDVKDRVPLVVAAVKRHESQLADAIDLRRFVGTLVQQVDGLEAVLG
jgi:hypothetical protein